MVRRLVSWLRPTAPAAPARPRGRRLGVDRLEDRTVPAVTASLDPYGYLTVTGSAAGEWIAVRQANGVVTVDGARIQVGSGWYSVLAPSVSASAVGWVVVNAGEGNDSVWLGLTSISSTVYGEGGDDWVMGGGGSDWLFGGPGNDTLYGDDSLSPWGAGDYLFGESGDDKLVPVFGADAVFGGEGSDLVAEYGVAWAQVSDTALGARDWDRLESIERVELTGTAGDDYLDARWFGGPVTLSGYDGRDYLVGGRGDDRLYAGGGGGELHGSTGNDSLYGGSGRDLLSGWEGNDYAAGEGENDTLWGWTGNDTLLGGGWADSVLGEDGADTLDGQAGNDTLDGGNQDDLIRGGDDADWLYGQDGWDTLYGGGGTDWLFGGAGRDGLFGGAGVDFLFGGADADRLLTTGEDFLDPGAGDMPVYFKSGGWLVNGLGVYFAGAWTDAEVERVDQALAVLHRFGNGAKLLGYSDGTPHTFVRHAGGGRGFDGGGVHLTDDQVLGTDDWLFGYVLHEMGHGWQGKFWNGQWAAIFGNSTEYVSDYAKSGWNDDFAETFAAYFTQKAGRAWYNPKKDGTGGAAAASVKVLFIDAWLPNV